MGFNERKQLEDEYINQYLNNNPKWKRNPVGLLPDLTKPDGSYQDIKFVDVNGKYFNDFITAQKKGIVGGEIDDWKDNNILERCEYKFILPKIKSIYIIKCEIFLNNVFKEIDGREPTEKYSGTAFYICRIQDFIWNKIEEELFKGKKYEVYECKCENQLKLCDYM